MRSSYILIAVIPSLDHNLPKNIISNTIQSQSWETYSSSNQNSTIIDFTGKENNDELGDPMEEQPHINGTEEHNTPCVDNVHESQGELIISYSLLFHTHTHIYFFSSHYMDNTFNFTNCSHRP